MKLKYIFGRLVAIVEDEGPLDKEAGVVALFIPCEGEEFDIIFVHPECKNKKQAILHEEIHAVLNRLGLNSTDLSLDAQEIICEGLATYFTEAYSLKEKV
jgi:hypothetical protein